MLIDVHTVKLTCYPVEGSVIGFSKPVSIFPWWILEHVCFLQNSTASMLFREVFLLKRTFSCCRSLTNCCWIYCSAAVLTQAEMVIDGRPCWRCGGARHEWRSVCRSKVSRRTALHSFSALNANPARAWVGESTRLLRRISIALRTAPARHRRCFQWCLQGSFLLLPPPPCAEVMARKDGVRWKAAPCSFNSAAWSWGESSLPGGQNQLSQWWDPPGHLFRWSREAPHPSVVMIWWTRFFSQFKRDSIY